MIGPTIPSDAQFAATVKERLFDLATDARLRGQEAFANTCDLARAGDLLALDQVIAALKLEAEKHGDSR